MQKKRNNIKSVGTRIFSKFFGFEEGVDITNDTSLLVRRNIVIKNIIFMSNVVYSLILIFLSLSTQGVSDWVVTVLAFPITFMINQILVKLINLDKNDKTKQYVAMYVAGFYIFFSSILIYARLYTVDYYETASYIIIFYSVVVISLYQDKRLLSSSFLSMVLLLTVIHLLWTYNLQDAASGYTIVTFIPVLINSSAFQDILLRTILFVLFYFVVYSIVSMGQYMQIERKEELIRRRQVQKDFSLIVKDLFSVVFSKSDRLLDSRHAYQVKDFSMKLAKDIGLQENLVNELGEYSTIHLKFEEIKDLVSKDDISESNYQLLKEKTKLGSNIAKRLQLSQKCEDIIRAQTVDACNEKFINEMVLIQPELISQVILMSDIYLTLRAIRSYKRPLSHSNSINLIESNLSVFFERRVVDRFIKFSDDYDEMYLNL